MRSANSGSEQQEGTYPKQHLALRLKMCCRPWTWPAKQAALSCARRILGVTDGEIRSAIPNHSGECIRLQTRLRLLRVVRREL